MGSNNDSDHAASDNSNLTDLAYERARRTHRRKDFKLPYEAPEILDYDLGGDDDTLYGGPCPNNLCDHPLYDHDDDGRCHSAADDSSPAGADDFSKWGLCGCGRS